MTRGNNNDVRKEVQYKKFHTCCKPALAIKCMHCLVHVKHRNSTGNTSTIPIHSHPLVISELSVPKYKRSIMKNQVFNRAEKFAFKMSNIIKKCESRAHTVSFGILFSWPQ
jgi:hypothetical protein